MKKPVQLSDRLYSGDQPSEDDFRHLAESGFRSVINLRKEGEPNQRLTPQAEQQCAEANGLNYASVPVVIADLRDELVDQLAAAADVLPVPIYVYCAGGQRSAALSILCEHAGSGETGDELLADAAAKGARIIDKNLIRFVRTVADERRTIERSQPAASLAQAASI